MQISSSKIVPFAVGRQAWRVLPWALGLVLLCGPLLIAVHGAAYTNVTVANANARGFAVVWGASTEAALGLQIYADAGGLSNVTSQLSVEFLPLRAGNPAALTDYEQRQSLASLRAKTRSYALAMAAISGARPATDYYIRVATIAGGVTNYSPALANPPLPVRTAAETAFVSEALQLLVEVPGQNVAGRIVMLSHTNSPYALAAVVGDGASSNQVIFNVTELLALGGLSNFTASGSQVFRAEVLGTGIEGGVAQDFALNFSGAFAVAQTYLGSFSSELASFSLGAAVTQTGRTSSVPVRVYSTVGVSRFEGMVQIRDGTITNLTLVPVAPQVDPAKVSVTRLGLDHWQVAIETLAGQQFFGDQEICRLQFIAPTNARSAFVHLLPISVDAVKPNASLVPDVLIQRGRVVIIGREPLIEPVGQIGGQRQMLVYGRPWASYLVEGAATATETNWQVLVRYPSTNLVNSVMVPADPAVRFYRAADFQANPPVMALGRSGQGISDMLIYGQEQGSYTLQYKSSLSPVAPWQDFLTFTITNSFGYVGNLPATNTSTFYRLIKN